jgi:hypothetical protein
VVDAHDNEANDESDLNDLVDIHWRVVGERSSQWSSANEPTVR